MVGPELSRRELLGAGVAAGAALAVGGAGTAAAAEWSRTLDFAALGEGDGWPGWTCPGVANLRRAGGQGLLEAGTDVFPCDPRPVAFAVDQRFRDGRSPRRSRRPGAGAGRRPAARAPARLLRRDPRRRAGRARDRAPLAGRRGGARRAPVGARGRAAAADVRRRGRAADRPRGDARRPAGAPTRVLAHDSSAPLQRAGDPGVLATARTLFPSEGPAVLPALGNLHLLPYGVQEGAVVTGSPAGEAVLERIRERSTAAFARIVVGSGERAKVTAPSVVAATTGAPAPRGALLRVATDVPARVEIEIATNARVPPQPPGERRAHRRLRRRDRDHRRAARRAPRLLAGAPAARRRARRSGRPAASARSRAPGSARARDDRRSARAPPSSGRRSTSSSRAARRLRLAGRPQLPGHDGPAGPDGPRATPASGATSSPTRG